MSRLPHVYNYIQCTGQLFTLCLRTKSAKKNTIQDKKQDSLHHLESMAFSRVLFLWTRLLQDYY